MKALRFSYECFEVCSIDPMNALRFPYEYHEVSKVPL